MAITVPVAGQEISVSTFGKPVADEVNRLTPLVDNRSWSAWQPIAFNAPWTNYGGAYPPTQVRKSVGLDLLMVRGGITGGNANTNVGTLPAGYRPAYQFEFITYIYAGGVGWSQIAFQTSGNVICSGTWTGALAFAAMTFFIPLSA